MDEKLVNALKSVEQKLENVQASVETKAKETEVKINDFSAEIKKVREEEAIKLAEQKKFYEDFIKALEASRAVSLPGSNEQKEKFSFFKMSKALLAGGTNAAWEAHAPFEKRIFDETAKIRNAAGTSPATAGGYIVPTQISSEFIDLLWSKTTLEALGATIIKDLVGEMKLPKITGGATAYWINENKNTITESDMTYGQLSMRPKILAAMSVFSKTFLNATYSVGLEAMVRENFSKKMAQELFRAALLGTGVEGHPMGVKNVPGISTHTIGGSRLFEYVAADRMLGKLEDANALEGNIKFVTNPKVVRGLKQQRIPMYSGDTGGLYQGLISRKMMEEAIGYPIMTSTLIPATLSPGTYTDVFVGNWSELLIGFFQSLEFAMSGSAGTAFESHQVKIKASMEVDTQVRHEESFCVCSDADTTNL